MIIGVKIFVRKQRILDRQKKDHKRPSHHHSFSDSNSKMRNVNQNDKHSLTAESFTSPQTRYTFVQLNLLAHFFKRIRRRYISSLMSVVVNVKQDRTILEERISAATNYKRPNQIYSYTVYASHFICRCNMMTLKYCM